MRSSRSVAVIVLLLLASSAWAQSGSSGQITGVVRDPDGAVVAGAPVTATNQVTHIRITTATNSRGAYALSSVEPGRYVVEGRAEGFTSSMSPELNVVAGQTVTADLALAVAGMTESVTVSARVENAYRVEHVTEGGPLGATPILNLPYTVNVISRHLIDDTQARNFKEAAKYLPLVSFQEMQGPEVLRPGTRGMQGSNMQNDRKDGMGFAVTTPSALEEYEQLEVISGLSGPLYGPVNPSGVFNFVTKRPTDAPLRQFEVEYEGRTVATGHADLGGRVGTNGILGYRTNLVFAKGDGYVSGGQLQRKLGALALDVRPSSKTTLEGNISYYNLFQHGYPGWFAYTPTTTPPTVSGSKSILLPVDAPDPTRQGYGQPFSGVDLTSKFGELRVKHQFSPTWHLVAGVLTQHSNRNINTAVNQFINNQGDYKTYMANSFSALAPVFVVTSDSLILTGQFNTGTIRHDVTIGGSGYRFASSSAVTSPAKTALCTENASQGVCQTNLNLRWYTCHRRLASSRTPRPVHRPASTCPASSTSRDSAWETRSPSRRAGL
jgi:iron complex outermembrane recepter protein